MGWFDSQIQERLAGDKIRMADAVSALSEALTGRGGATARGRATEDAVADIMAYFGARPQDLGQGSRELVDVLEAQMRPQGIMYREVTLERGWSREAAGALLATRTDGSAVALLPHGARGYAYRDHALGRMVRVGANDLEGLEPRALLFYRPLPSRALTVRDLAAFMLKAVARRDWALVGLAALASAALGLVLPALNAYVFGPLVSGGEVGLVAPVAMVMVSVSVAQLVIGSMRTLLVSRVHTSASSSLSAAMMMRVLQLPASAFKGRASGDWAMRLSCVELLCEQLQSLVLGCGLTLVFSLLYVVQSGLVAPALLVPAWGSTLASCAVMALVAWARSKALTQRLLAQSRRRGWEYALLGGMQKIRLAGAESRAYATWADIYKDEVRLGYRGPVLVRYGRALQTGVSLAGTLWIYVVAAQQGVAVADYLAFSAAYAVVSAALVELGNAVADGVSVRPYLEMVRPLMETAPETEERRHAPARVSGGIELDRVTFAYGEGLQPVLKDLSLKIRPGEYVGVVGRTGCGKSTLLRLLLGFEEPQTGAVYYDGRDLASLDPRSLRRNIGVVLQDGKLFSGDIYSNIVVGAPWLTVQDAWAAAELAGIADDIRAMPMGMQTVISEGSGGISGGQRQRIMIARAIVAKPKILMFDEATSALDNVAQRAVAESLAQLRCTRIAIAHRLSTVRHCDRILVLDGGRVAESGTYEELMAKDGVFAELVRRQQV